ncbi:mitochondrial inner membrane protease subunit 2 protein [Rutstroemia sp. NJR-2017a WRK4]|nr:mitochondrial inner membrane protease subunit 2 protein [Rutstroemia sp. NJR-2017a WRK4]
MSQRLFSTIKGAKVPKFLTEFTYYSFALVSWVPAVIFFNDHVAAFQFVNGPSMYPFLNNSYNESRTKDCCFVDKRSPYKDLQRGMLVSFWSPSHPDTMSVKRVIGLEGDRVYTRAPYPYPYADVPAGHVWLEGDNAGPNKSLDSNHYGPISMSLITGQLKYIVWPRSSFGPIRWWEFKGKTRVIKGWNIG